MSLSRRSLILAPAVLVPRVDAGAFVPILGGVITFLFREVLKVGIEVLITSAAKHLWANHLNPQRANTFVPYIEGAQVADNFCAYCTVEYAAKGKVFWTGALLAPNEENEFYRSRGEGTDDILLNLLTDPDSLWHLDAGRSRAAHVPSGVLESLRRSAHALQKNKTRLYHEIMQYSLTPGELSQYLVPKPLLDEVDKIYRHVMSKQPGDYHINPRYVESVIVLQRYVTWFNTKLAAVETATFKPDLFA